MVRTYHCVAVKLFLHAPPVKFLSMSWQQKTLKSMH